MALPYAPGSTEPPINDSRKIGDLTRDEMVQILSVQEHDVNDYPDYEPIDYSGFADEDLVNSLVGEGNRETPISALGAYWKLASELLDARGIHNKFTGEGGEGYYHKMPGESLGKQARDLIERAVPEGEEDHPQLAAFRGIFSIDPLANEKLMEWVGQWVEYTDPQPRDGLIALLPFKVVHLQKLWNQTIGLRLENQGDHFGRAARISDVSPISVEEAKVKWDNNFEAVYGGRTFEPFNPGFDEG